MPALVYRITEVLSAIPFGLITSVGHVGTQTVPLVRQIMRAPSATTTEVEVVSAVLAQVATELASDEEDCRCRPGPRRMIA